MGDLKVMIDILGTRCARSRPLVSPSPVLTQSWPANNKHSGQGSLSNILYSDTPPAPGHEAQLFTSPDCNLPRQNKIVSSHSSLSSNGSHLISKSGNRISLLGKTSKY